MLRELENKLAEEKKNLQEKTANYEVATNNLTERHARQIRILKSALAASEGKLSDSDMQLSRVSGQLEECISSNALLSQELCQLRMLTKERPPEPSSSNDSFETQEREAQADSEAQQRLEAALALMEQRLDETSGSLWRVQDQLDVEMAKTADLEIALSAATVRANNMDVERVKLLETKNALESRLKSESLKLEKSMLEAEDLDRQVNRLVQQMAEKATECSELKLSHGIVSYMPCIHYIILAIAVDTAGAEASIAFAEINAELQSALAELYEANSLNRKLQEDRSNLEDAVVIERVDWGVAKLQWECSEKVLIDNISALQQKLHNAAVETDAVKFELSEKDAQLVKGKESLEEAIAENLVLQSKMDKVIVTEATLTNAESTEKDTVEHLTLKLAMLSDAFEKSRGIKVPLDSEEETDCRSIKDLQQLLARSDNELIKRASKNASLQYEVDRLTAIQARHYSNVDGGCEWTALVAELQSLKEELQFSNEKFERMSELNKNLNAKVRSYHQVTSLWQEEVLNNAQMKAEECGHQLKDELSRVRVKPLISF